jgi:hypothetical protein
MAIQQQLQAAPRTAIRAWFRAAELPVRAVQAIAQRGERDAEWPPALAFESLASHVMQLTGSVLRDDELVQEGRLIQAKVAQLRKAAELETVAERREAIANAKFESTRESAEQRRQRLEREAAEQERALEREAKRKQSAVEAKVARKRSQAAKSEATTRKAIAREERAAASARPAQERESLRKERAAVSAKTRATTADKKIRATRVARNAGR